MTAILAKLIAMFLAHRAPEPAKVIPVHTTTYRYRYIGTERVDVDHDEDDHEDNDGFEHNTEECESW